MGETEQMARDVEFLKKELPAVSPAARVRPNSMEALAEPVAGWPLTACRRIAAFHIATRSAPSIVSE